MFDYTDKQLVTIKTGKLAKQAGFPQDERFLESHYDQENDEYIILPSQSLLQKWLREEHGIHVEILVGVKFYEVGVYDKGQYKKSNYYGEEFNIYEEALEKGLQEALKLINN